MKFLIFRVSILQHYPVGPYRAEGVYIREAGSPPPSAATSVAVREAGRGRSAPPV